MISIVLPTLNAARYLPEFLGSLLAQEFTDFELIVVDGGSSDETLTLVRSFKIGSVQILNESRKGQAQAVTTGIAAARGEIVHWHAADDIIMPGALKAVAEFFSTHPTASLLISDGTVFGAEMYGRMPTCRWLDARSMLFYQHNFLRFQSDSAYWRSSSEESRTPLAQGMELNCDEDFFLRIAVNGHMFWLPKSLGAFRLHGDQVSQRVDRSKLQQNRSKTREDILRSKGIEGFAKAWGLLVCFLPAWVINYGIVQMHRGCRRILDVFDGYKAKGKEREVFETYLKQCRRRFEDQVKLGNPGDETH